MNKINEFLSDFEFIESDRLPTVTLDKSGRFNPNVSARNLIGITPFMTVTVGYNATTQEIAFIPHEYANYVKGAASARYNVDRRYYMSARAFAKNYGFYGKTVRFDYVRGMSGGEVFVFKLRDEFPL